MKLDRIRKIARKNMPDISDWPRERIETAISDISSALVGYGIGAGERIALNEERHVLRERLSVLTAKASP